MTTMTRPAVSVAGTRFAFAATAAFAALVWIIAALCVGGAHVAFDPLWPAFGAAVEIAVILLCAGGYMRFCAPRAGAGHALGVGIAWLTFGIITEIVVTMRLGHGWYAILGSPQRPLLRNVFLFVWIFAPALFARREELD